ncbi:hypothetical protein [Desulfopila sp. IMCC35008]|uniref:hypothetical protein n=1 Tax=Desulfopila sp. IMCC35008 TaxID=2653858 RepID=UPI0013D45195|nr:hypothetical protein [Desulfopila sp. IMCC35008]
MRTQRIETRDGVIWRKYPEPPSSKLWMHNLLTLFARVTGWSMFTATSSKGGLPALMDEAERLKHFQDKGVRVPALSCVTDHYIEMKELGQELGKLIDSMKDNPDKQLVYIKKAARALADIHQKGLAHGRPHLKDITWSNETGQVGFLDLEEDVSVMPFKEAQARDIWLFMGSVTEHLNYQTDKIEQVYKTYKAYHPCKEVEHHLFWFVRKVKPVLNFVECFFRNKLGKDAKNVLVCQKVLEQYNSQFGPYAPPARSAAIGRRPNGSRSRLASHGPKQTA